MPPSPIHDGESRIRSLVDALADAIVVVNLHGSVRYANPAAAQLFRLSLPDLLQQPFGFPIAGHGTTEVDILRKDGTTGVAEMRVVRTLWGSEDAHLAILRDITEAKKLEADRLQFRLRLEQEVADRTSELQAANLELDAFCHSVSHDLLTPLRAIAGFSDILLQNHLPALDPAAQDLLQRILQAASKMRALIDDLLHLSRVSRADLVRQPTNLSDLARHSLADLAHLEPHRRIHISIQDGLLAHGDRRLLAIALENLLRNAWKFTSKTPSPIIEVGCLPNPDSPAEPPVFFVRDNGAGFPMDQAHHLFQPFRRLHRDDDFPGTGIGLVTAQRIIQRHGGSLWARASPNLGATFFFLLPPHPAPPTPTPCPRNSMS